MHKTAKEYYLYRFIDIAQLVNLLKTHRLDARKEHSFPRGMTPGISFTRNPNMSFMRFSEAPIRLVVNGNTLEKHYKLHSYSDFAHYWNTLKTPEGKEQFDNNPSKRNRQVLDILNQVQESEEFVEGTITHAFDYIEAIDINLYKLVSDHSATEVFDKFYKRLKIKTNATLSKERENTFFVSFLTKNGLTYETWNSLEENEKQDTYYEFVKQQENLFMKLPLMDSYKAFIKKLIPTHVKLRFTGEVELRDYTPDELRSWFKVPKYVAPKRLSLKDNKNNKFPVEKELPEKKSVSNTCFIKVKRPSLSENYAEIDNIYSNAENVLYGNADMVFKLNTKSLMGLYKKVDWSRLLEGKTLFDLNMRIPFSVLNNITREILVKSYSLKEKLSKKITHIPIKLISRPDLVPNEDLLYNKDEQEKKTITNFYKTLKYLPPTLYWYPSASRYLFSGLPEKMEFHTESKWDNNTFMEVLIDSDVFLALDSRFRLRNQLLTDVLKKTKYGWELTAPYYLDMETVEPYIKHITYTNPFTEAGNRLLSQYDVNELEKMYGARFTKKYTNEKIL